MSSIQERLAALHRPDLIASPDSGDGGMVCQVWEDGEVTLTKGGSLWGQRTVHTIKFGEAGKGIPFNKMPVQQSNKHGYVVVPYEELRYGPQTDPLHLTAELGAGRKPAPFFGLVSLIIGNGPKLLTITRTPSFS